MNGKKVIVTGGNKGIGFATAQKFLEAGAKVLITGRREEALKEACEKLQSDHVSYLLWDVSDVSQMDANFQKAYDMLGGLDVLVNNAGVLTDTDFITDFWNVTEADWNYTQETNLRGVFFMCQKFAKFMTERNLKGHIVNVCSEMGFRPVNVTYGITKWGVRGMTYGLGMTLAPYGIVVNGVAPGAIATSMMRWHEGDSMVRESHKNGRFGTPEEIGDLIVFLASSKADNIIGEIVLSDGGSHLH